jgi:flagellar motor switch protein FliN/FliY
VSSPTSPSTSSIPTPELDPSSAPAAGTDAAPLAALMDVSMPVIIEVGRTMLTVQEILKLTGGSVIPLDRMLGEPVDLYVSDRKLAEAEVVVIGDQFGVRITRMLMSPGGEARA